MILMQLDRDSHRQILCSTRLADTIFTALKIRTTDHLTSVRECFSRRKQHAYFEMPQGV